MLNFKGFDDWVEIFMGGPQTDNLGRAHDGDALVAQAVETWDPTFHEPPAVVGHPGDDAPAYGWVSAVKAGEADGKKVLLAKFRDVEPQFADLVAQGRYPKRSASFYPDGRLRHVGFLGAAPPAVKGLKNIQFTAGEDAIAFEFEESRPWTWRAIADSFRRLKNFLIEKEGAERAEEILPEWDIESVKEEESRAFETLSNEEDTMKFSEFMQAINIFKKLGGKDEDIDLIAPAEAPPAAPGGQFTEADIEKAKAEAAAAAKQQAAAEFAEAEKTRAATAAKAKIAAFCEQGVASGKLAPAWIQGGIKEFMHGLVDLAPAEFGEEKKNQTPLDWFLAFMEGLPQLVDFSEIATRGKNVGGSGAGEKLAQLVKKRMEEKKDLSYSAAFAEVQSENPALAQEYLAEFTG